MPLPSSSSTPFNTQFPDLYTSPTTSMAPKNHPYPHFQDLWIWNWTRRFGGGRSGLVRPLSWQILGILLQWNRWSCARSIWQEGSELTDETPVYLSQRKWLNCLPVPTLRSPSPSLPGYYTASCPRTPQEMSPFYRPWVRHPQRRQTYHLWVLRFGSTSCSVLRNPGHVTVTTAHRLASFLFKRASFELRWHFDVSSSASSKKAPRQRGVCVNHPKRCETSNLFDFQASRFDLYVFFIAICRGPGTHDCLSWPTKTRQHGGVSVP